MDAVLSRRWHLAERIVCDSLTRRKAWGLLLSGSMVATTAILLELDLFFMLPDTGFIIDPRRSELTRILLRCQCLLDEKVCRYVEGGLSESPRV